MLELFFFTELTFAALCLAVLLGVLDSLAELLFGVVASLVGVTGRFRKDDDFSMVLLLEEFKLLLTGVFSVAA